VAAALEPAPAAPEVPEPEVPAAEPGPAAEPAALEAASPADGFQHLARLGVNVELGLGYCAGDGNFYREMLRMFAAQAQEKHDEIASLYESADWEGYTVKVHALKSTSLTIGAEALSAQAKELELAGKRGDIDLIHARHAALMRAYEELCAQIAGQ